MTLKPGITVEMQDGDGWLDITDLVRGGKIFKRARGQSRVVLDPPVRSEVRITAEWDGRTYLLHGDG